MFKQIKTTKLGLSAEEIIWGEIADQLHHHLELQRTFRQHFRRNTKQQAVRDLIESSQAPPGEPIHVLLYGSTGSGKSWTAFAEVADILLEYPGVTALAVRRTYDEVDSSIYPKFGEFFNTYDIRYRTNKKEHTYFLPNGSTLKMTSAEKTARSKLDKADHLGSTEYSVVVLEECDEITEEFINTIPGRMRENKGVARKVVFYICNPPSKGHWLYQKFFLDNDPNDPRSIYRAVHMPVEDNVEFVGQAYIDSIYRAWAGNPSLLKRMAKGEFGPDIKGDPLFLRVFSEKVHVADRNIAKSWNPAYPLARGWDFGWRGMALVVLQDDKDTGQIRVYRDILESKVLLDSFADRWLSRLDEEFPGARWIDFCDPAGVQKTGLNEKSYIDILRAKGLHPRYDRTAQEYGLAIIEEQLRMTLPSRHGPVPAIYIDPGCSHLIEALAFGYCNEKGLANDIIKPVKDGTYDHIMDAFRYVIIHLRRPSQGRPRAKDYTRGGEWGTVGGMELRERSSNRPRVINVGESATEGVLRRRRQTGPSYGFSRPRRF